MVIRKSFKAGEGTLEVEMKDNGIKLTYGSIDDFCTKNLNVDDLMKLLGYTKL